MTTDPKDYALLLLGVAFVTFVGLRLWARLFRALASVADKKNFRKLGWWPSIVIGTWFTILATAIMALNSGQWSSLWDVFLVAPIVGSILYISRKWTVYCDACGSSRYQIPELWVPSYCAVCRRLLDPTKPPPVEDIL